MRSGGPFPSTLWSVVLAAGEGAPVALETLALRYMAAIYGFIRRAGRSREDAEDLAQDFFAHLIESGAFARADPARGRFRSFLCAALRNFLLNDADRRRTQKRGGGRRRVAFDAEAIEASLGRGREEDPAAEFDRDWARGMLARALERLRAELSPTAAEAFALAHEDEAPSYRQIGERLGLSEGAVAASVFRGRRRLRDLLVEEARATVATDADVEGELADLLGAFGG